MRRGHDGPQGKASSEALGQHQNVRDDLVMVDPNQFPVRHIPVCASSAMKGAPRLSARARPTDASLPCTDQTHAFRRHITHPRPGERGLSETARAPDGPPQKHRVVLLCLEARKHPDDAIAVANFQFATHDPALTWGESDVLTALCMTRRMDGSLPSLRLLNAAPALELAMTTSTKRRVNR